MQLDQDKAVAVCVQYYLRTLMRLEREKYGWNAKDAAAKAKWPAETWQQLENHELPIEPHHWINICAVMDLNDDRLARRMDAFINKNPVLIVACNPKEQLEIFEKALTSPRLIRNQNIFTLNLAPVRSKLYDILSLYSPDGETLIEVAKQRNYYFDSPETPLKPSFKRHNTGEKRELRRTRLSRMVTDKIIDEKLEALEAALNLIHDHDVDAVDRAVEIMAMVLDNR